MTFQRSGVQGERPVAPTAPTAPTAASVAAPKPPAPTVAAAPGAAASPSPATPSPTPMERLTYRPAAEAWPEGSAPLMRWLRANPDVVGELLGARLTISDEEVAGFDSAVFVDDEQNRLLVVLELGESTDATFGTLMTRLTAAGTQAALWICGSARADHIAAVSWLNRMVDARFFIARMRAAQIGGSRPAPVLELTLRPPRATDGPNPAPQPTGSPERGRRADDWREMALGEVTG
jgi:hypothetical protein